MTGKEEIENDRGRKEGGPVRCVTEDLDSPNLSIGRISNQDLMQSTLSLGQPDREIVSWEIHFSVIFFLIAVAAAAAAVAADLSSSRVEGDESNSQDPGSRSFGILGSIRWDPDLSVSDPDPKEDPDPFWDLDPIFLLNKFKIKTFCLFSSWF